MLVSIDIIGRLLGKKYEYSEVRMTMIIQHYG